jgi:hypothetical protein
VSTRASAGIGVELVESTSREGASCTSAPHAASDANATKKPSFVVISSSLARVGRVDDNSVDWDAGGGDHGAMRRLLFVLLVVGCGKKQAEPAPPAASTTASAPLTVTSSAVVPSAEPPKPPPVDESVETELAWSHELAFSEGKVLPIAKFPKPSPDALKEHTATLQAQYEDQVKGGCKELSRFNLSAVPATYVFCELPERAAVGTTIEARANIVRMLSIEMSSWDATDISSRGSTVPEFGDPTPYELWNTSRGYFIDLDGSGAFTYFLRRRRKAIPPEPANEGGTLECLAKTWNPATNSVHPATKVPTFPTRGRDLDDDGKPEYPAAIFRFALPGVTLASAPTLDGCNLKTNGAVTIDVVGVEDDDGDNGAFYKRRLAAARAREKKIAAFGDKEKTRKHGDVRLTNACALDVAQTAAQVFVYARLTGTSAPEAALEAESVMKGFGLAPGACPAGLSFDTFTQKEHDYWPELRAALVAWQSKSIPAAPSPAPSGSASAP